MSSIPSLCRQSSPPPRIRRPRLLRFASMMHLMTRLMFALSVVSAPFFFVVAGVSPANWLILPGTAILFGVVWGISACQIRCSVCSMRLLIHQPCRKHSKAPNWPVLGHHGTLAVQAMYSRKVRCPYCGTPNLLVAPSEKASR